MPSAGARSGFKTTADWSIWCRRCGASQRKCSALRLTAYAHERSEYRSAQRRLLSPVFDFTHNEVWRLKLRAEKDFFSVEGGRHGIDLRCPPCRNVAGSQGDENQKQHDRPERDRIGGTQSKQERAQRTGEGERPANSNHDADECCEHPLPQHE